MNWNARIEGAFPQLKCYRRVIVASKEDVTEGTMSIEEQMNVDERRKYLEGKGEG